VQPQHSRRALTSSKVHSEKAAVGSKVDLSYSLVCSTNGPVWSIFPQHKGVEIRRGDVQCGFPRCNADPVCLAVPLNNSAQRHTDMTNLASLFTSIREHVWSHFAGFVYFNQLIKAAPNTFAALGARLGLL
jgi:hypothetical protein